MKKNYIFKVFQLLLLFLSLLFFLFIFSNNVLAHSDFYFQYNNESYVLPFLNTPRYDESTDFVILVYTTKDDFNSFGCVVLKNAKTYINQGYKIMTKLSSSPYPWNYGYGYNFYYFEDKISPDSSNILNFYLFRYDSSSNSWGQWGNMTTGSDALTNKSTTFIYSDYDLYKSDFSLRLEGSLGGFVSPYIVNSSEDLSDGLFDSVIISGGDLVSSEDSDVIDFVIRQKEVIETSAGPYERLKVLYSTKLDWRSIYLETLEVSSGYYQDFYSIPRKDIGIDFSDGVTYVFSLEYSLNGKKKFIDYEFTCFVTPEDKEDDVIGSLSSQLSEDNKKLLEEERNTQQKIEEQTGAIKEQTEVNKNIFDKLGDLLSYINPFSENFFVYKLIDLLVDALKSLFVPSDGFFDTYFDNLMNFFSERFGFLAYPFELSYSVLERYLSLGSAEAGFTIPDISEPSTGETLIHETHFSFDDFLNEHETFKLVHDYYLIFVDFIIAILLLRLAIRKWNEVLNR